MMGKQNFKACPKDVSKFKANRNRNWLNKAKQMKNWPNLKIQVVKPHPNLIKICEHDLMNMGNNPITLDWKNNVKKCPKISISTIRLSIFLNNSKSSHPIKKLRSYLESRHQNTSSYVVKSEKSIVDMLIVELRRCDQYTNTHEISFYTKKRVKRSSFMHRRVTLERFPRATRLPDHI